MPAPRGGPGALAWSRFDAPARVCVRAHFLEAIAQWPQDHG